MINYKRFINALIAITYISVVSAQTSTNSPYTRYGFGQLSDQTFGHTQAMGGIGIGLRNGLHVNVANPASYSAVDSLTFLFDAGMTLQNANFTEGSVKTNAKNSSFDYLAMQFRLCKGLGFTAGILPYSTVGYSFNNYEDLKDDGFGNKVSTSTSHTGDGSLRQIFMGLGYNVFKNLSVGANFSYLYGDIKHNVTTTFNQADAYSSVRVHTISINSYKVDLGLQYTYNLKKKHAFTLGAIYSLGHDLNGDAYHSTATHETTPNGVFVKGESTDTISNAFSLPHSFGLGLTYVYNKRLTVGFDYTFQKWSGAKFYEKKNQFNNRTKYAIGAEYLPNPIGRSYLKRIRYRVGAYYSTPYTKMEGAESMREYGISAGFGLPLEIRQGKSILNLSGQFVRVEPKTAGLLKETYLRINIGLTFNERWFSKWKVD